MGRTQKATKNIVTGLVNKAALMLLAFVTKTAFIRLLGAEYNGVSSLYTNILSVLALAELGVGNVLMFYLYAALERKNEEEVSALVYEFKKIYNAIIVCVLAVGLALVPFLQFLVNSNLERSELIIYYLLYLANSVASYFVVYRTTVIRADRSSMGLFKEVQYINIAAAVLNIILSIALEHRGGLAGIIIATAISRLLTSFWYEAKVVFEKLERPVSEYFKIQAKDLLIASCIIGICYFVTSHIHTSGLIGLFIKVFVCLVISGCAECMAHHKEKEFEFFLNKIQQIGKR